ncbi:aspartyl protease family protein [Salvia divinorum]|uniref:Aspartyl protease family protein n=1 Tax=Salvia divinorum TaxID=28513 RepID=A0ABD1I5X5_SALDI
MVDLLILVAFSLFSGVFSLGEKELLSFKRMPTTPAPTRFFHTSKNVSTILEMKHNKHLQKGLTINTINYIVTVTLGSRNLTVIVDTGSDLSLVQCQLWRLCYTQPEHLFNPLVSPSYILVQCESQPCHTLSSNTGNSGLCESNVPKCNYAVIYGGGSYTRGELGRDRLTLGNTPVDNFVFRCGRNNRGLFGAASGLMGLGRSDLSLISQTSNVFGGVFSYLFARF